MTRIIKRYANRKLYDTKQSSYVTLDQIQAMVEEGEDLRILDNKSKDDITNSTLAQIIFEREKAKEKTLPLSALRAMIQSGENFQERAPVGQMKKELKAIASTLPSDDQNAIKVFIESTKTSLNDMQDRIDIQLKHNVDQMDQLPTLERDIGAMDLRLRDIEEALKRIEKRLNTKNELDLSGTSHDPHQDLPQ